MNISGDVWIWISAIILITGYSSLFKYNPLYKIMESSFVGLTMGYSVVTNFHNYLKPTVVDKIVGQGRISLLLPLLLGLLMYTRYFKPVSWLSRYTQAFIMGVGASYILTKDFPTMVVAQVIATIKPLLSPAGALTNINNTIIFIGVVSVTFYFLFTVKREGPIRYISSLGRIFLMIALGAAFGNTVMGRVSTTFAQFNFLLRDWLGII